MPNRPLMRLKTLFIAGVLICSHRKCMREAMDGSKFCACHAWGKATLRPKGEYNGMRPNNGYSRFGGI